MERTLHRMRCEFCDTMRILIHEKKNNIEKHNLLRSVSPKLIEKSNFHAKLERIGANIVIQFNLPLLFVNQNQIKKSKLAAQISIEIA